MKYYNGEYKERHIVNSGDIIIANTDMTADRAILGSPIFVPKLKTKKVIFTHHLFAFSGLKLTKAFLYYYLKSNTFRERAENYANGTTVLSLSKEDVLGIKMMIPDNKILDSYSGLVDRILDQKEQLTMESNWLSTIRDSLLPKLMSGEVRVPIEEVQ
jgi:type I restriction enzyme, S subunit